MDLRESVLSQHMGKESSEEFKRLMWSERRPRLMRVLKEELTELDRYVRVFWILWDEHRANVES